jgi:hypothetical protein
MKRAWHRRWIIHKISDKIQSIYRMIIRWL